MVPFSEPKAVNYQNVTRNFESTIEADTCLLAEKDHTIKMPLGHSIKYWQSPLVVLSRAFIEIISTSEY